MEKAANEFGPFGSGAQKTAVRRGCFRRVLFYFFLLLLLVLFPLAYQGWSWLYVNVLEKEAPTINVVDPPIGLGADPLSIKVEVADVGAGLDEVIVRSEERGNVREILRQRYRGERKYNDTIAINLPGKESGLKEGDVTISITAFDRSYWSNRRLVSLNLKVDYQRPKIEVVSTQHNLIIGGAGLVFYKVNKSDIFSGIKVGAYFFPGFKASSLDKDFSTAPDLYFAFFSIPRDFQSADEIKLFARDDVRNISTADIYYTLHSAGASEHSIKLSDDFMQTRVQELYAAFLQLDAKLNARVYQPPADAENSEELIKRFKIINTDLRALIEKSLRPIFSRPKALRLWKDSFLRQPGSSAATNFGDRVQFYFGGAPIGFQITEGADLASRPAAPVSAANDGIVVFNDDLQIYGKAVIIDHGFGITTLYGQLDSSLVSEGDKVFRGQTIGAIGSSGLAQSTALHFEVRLSGIPVRPIEWWDQRWIAEHIQSKIIDTKKRLGIRIMEPLE